MSSSPHRSRFSRPRPTRRAQSGFALLITITLLAFLVLLLVSLAALTRVETQVAANGQQLAQARQNALMALNIALGELQKAAGPDQRTTATAVLGEGATAVTAANTADNGLAATANGTRHWTGVWGNKSAPDGIFTAAPQPVLLRWLVSGNENGPTVTAAADGHISAPATAADTTFKPSGAVTFASGGALSTSATATADLLIQDKANSNQPAILLVGGKTAGAHVDAFVVAPLVTINSNQVPGITGTTRVGRYAWWVGDEGVKAKYNLPDPYIANDRPDSGTSTDSRDSRYRLLAAQRNGIERITAFGDTNYPLAATSATSPLYLGVGNTLTPAGIRLTSPAVTVAALQNNFHDLTTHSYGVLADSQFGGLRRDLTFHLDANSGDTFLDGRAILPDGATPVSTFAGSNYAASPSLFSETTANGGLNFTTLNVSPRLGPKWDQLKSYYQLAYDHPTDLEVQPAVDLSVNPVKVQAAITPVILESRMMFSLKAGPSIDTSIIVVLGNPYSRRLTAPSGMDYRIALHPNRYTSAKFRGEELGLICNFVRPKPSDPDKKEISSVFTRRQGDSINFPTSGAAAAPTAPPLIMDYVDPSTLTDGAKDAGNTVFHHYYPILKFPVPADGDGPVDPDAGYPGVLDNVVFRLPPGLLDLEPGQARAYQIKQPEEVSTEMIGGVSTTVVALQQMTSIAPTYYSHVCNSRYVSDASVFSPAMFTSGSFFRTGLTITSDQGAFSANWDYTLTMPGRPGAVLQSLGPVGGIVWDTLLNRMLPSHTFFSDVFQASPTPISGVLHNRVLSYQNTAVYAERNLAGSRQSNAAWYNRGFGTNPYIAASILSPANFDAFEDASSFTDYLDPGNPIQAAWGRGEIGSPLRTAPQGKLVLFDAPSAGTADEIPLLSLGQLQHADLTGDDEAQGVNSQPGGVLGNSWYNRLVKRDSSRTDPVENSRAILFSRWENTSPTALGDTPRYPGYVPDLPKNTMIRRYDMSYLMNAALWDSWFFSTVRPAAGSSTAVALPANRRMAYAGGTPTLGQLRGADASAAVPVPGALGAGENGRVPAAQMLVNGAFNVNSTSVEAWTALLSGLRGLRISTTSAADPELTPFARSIRQPGGAQSVLPSGANAEENTYTGFRALTDDQISELARQIVAQVKARGPFLSLSQFVNRNLTPATAVGNAVGDTGLAGALQQAIDHTNTATATANRINYNLNTAALSLALETNATRAANNRAIYPDYDLMPTGAGSGLGTYMGAPGWLSQADLLQAVAPSLAARSDTFVIRVYGETVDPVNSPAAPAAPVVTARAWCEAVVQREADYMDTAVRPSVLPSAAGATNQAFGRRFRIVSFRWLSPDDI